MVSATHIYITCAKRTVLFTLHFSVYTKNKRSTLWSAVYQALCLELCVLWSTWEWDNIADVCHTCNEE